ncbi:hypothetical protein JOE11_000303 [Robbsia andropogonis]
MTPVPRIALRDAPYGMRDAGPPRTVPGVILKGCAR